MDLSYRYQPDTEVSYQRLEDATVIVHLGTGRIHHTNETGSRIWELLEEGRPLGEILGLLREEFETSPGQLEREVEEFIRQLSAEKMIQPVVEGA